MEIGDKGIVIGNEITKHYFKIGEKIECVGIDKEGDEYCKNEKGKEWYISDEEVEII